jgi:predicted unusual protein kinase regulating ubiquinone biosynthesis (AarF/ABC1/UbiB family)
MSELPSAPGLSLSPSRLKRYYEVVHLLRKYGQSDLIREAPLVDDPLPHAPSPPVPPEAKELVDDLEKLGPTFIKLGQLVSTRSDFLSPAVMEALSRLQDDVAPFPFEKVQAIVEVEIGARISKAFSEFDAEPVAAASIGQVHRAKLRNGQDVVVKVQRPGVREAIADDLEVLAELSGFLDSHTDMGRRYEFGKIIEQLRLSLIRELDYRQEAGNLRLMKTELKRFKKIFIPSPIDDYSSGRVLTMEYVSGQKVTKLSKLARMDLNGPKLAEELFKAYLHQILHVGVFHADPHPGNVFITDDHRVALLDMGMVARVGPRMQDDLIKLLLAISDGHSERAAEIAERMGIPRENYESSAFRTHIAALVSEQHAAGLEHIQVGQVVMRVVKTAAETGLSLPPELTMLGKTLLNLDLVGLTLWPEFNPSDAIRRNVASIMHKKTVDSLKPSNLMGAALEARELLERLPSRVNVILDHLAENKLRLDVRAVNEAEFIFGLQKIANRITLGLLIAASIMGAALLMRVDTGFRILGYPGLAMIFFLAAAAGAVFLAVHIIRSDRTPKR